MGLREELGGKLEAVLNKIVDEKFADLSLDALKAKAHEELDKQIDKLGQNLLAQLAEKLKKDVIDLIDGEDDIK